MKPRGIQVVKVLATGVCLVGLWSTNASAQMLQSTDRAFAGVNFGKQTKARTFTTSGSLPVYGETATFDTSVGIGNDDIVDVNAGARVWNNVGVGLGWSRYRLGSVGQVNASIPSPIFFDTPSSQSASVEGLRHRQSQVHLSVYWLQPVTDKVDLSLYAGPTFFSVRQDLATLITVTPGASTIASVTRSSVEESTTGAHFGFDVRYLVTRNVGAGIFARYASGSVDTPLVSAGKIDVGGFQYGIGIRLRY